MNNCFALTSYGLQNEIVRLVDGRLAKRAYNPRKGKWGWFVYSAGMVVEAFYTDKQWKAQS